MIKCNGEGCSNKTLSTHSTLAGRGVMGHRGVVCEAYTAICNGGWKGISSSAIKVTTT